MGYGHTTASRQFGGTVSRTASRRARARRAGAAGRALLLDEWHFIDLANSPIFYAEAHVVLEWKARGACREISTGLRVGPRSREAATGGTLITCLKVQTLRRPAAGDTEKVIAHDTAGGTMLSVFGRKGMLCGVAGISMAGRLMRLRGLLTTATSLDEAVQAAT